VNTVFWGKKDCISWVEAKQKASKEGITRNPRGIEIKKAEPFLALPCSLTIEY
jgi:hypothetical protein